jgi:hypothetical protein
LITKKKVLHVFVGLPGLMNNAQVLRLSLIYRKITWGIFFNELDLHEGIKHYIIGNKGYPLLPWMMVLDKQMGVLHFILETLINKRFSHAKVVVENNFGVLKKIFCELILSLICMWIFFKIWSYVVACYTL